MGIPLLPSSVVTDFAVIMTVAGAMTLLFHRLKQPLILGYLIAGMLIGPYTPPFALVTRFDVLGATADLGIILLLFAVGLEFPVARLRTSRFTTYAVIAIMEIALMLLVSFGIGWLLGWPFMDSLFLGAALSSSSTVIIAKVLGDMGKLKQVSALIMLGVLIVEDLFVVIMLAVITSVVGPQASTIADIAWTIGKIALFMGGSAVIGMLIVPRIIDRMAMSQHHDHTEHDEVFLLLALGMCFGLSILGTVFGLSIVIGAFLMGVFVASAKSAGKVTSLTASIKSMFAAIFFVSMGALIDVTQIRDFLVPALMVTAAMMFGKVLGCGLGTRLSGYDFDTSLKVGLGMGQIGEFALIVVKAGQDLDVISPFLFPTVGAAVAITAFLTPYMIRLSYRVASVPSHRQGKTAG